MTHTKATKTTKQKPFHIVEKRQYHPVFTTDAYVHKGFFVYRNNKRVFPDRLTRRNAREITKLLNRIIGEV